MNIYGLFLLPFVLLLRLFISNLNSIASAVSWTHKEANHEFKILPKDDLVSLLKSKSTSHNDFNATLDEILITRVPGTAGHLKVNKYIKQVLRDLDWTVEEDAFTANTPHGAKPFRNIVGTLNPTACKRLVFACHYDSKVSPTSTFLGATDSAVPCAMLIELIKMLDDLLKKHREERPEDVTLQLIFFDGEEAFEKWSDSDSLYGSRHLAEKWNKTPYPKTDEERKRCRNQGDIVSELDRIDLFILLDLIGAANPNFYSYFANTQSFYARLILIEQKLNDLRILESQAPQKRTSYFENRQTFAFIEDDHIPFMKRGVPIMHIIPSPFPSVWHLDSDNRQNLHHPTINNLLDIFKVFIVEYFHLI